MFLSFVSKKKKILNEADPRVRTPLYPAAYLSVYPPRWKTMVAIGHHGNMICNATAGDKRAPLVCVPHPKPPKTCNVQALPMTTRADRKRREPVALQRRSQTGNRPRKEERKAWHIRYPPCGWWPTQRGRCTMNEMLCDRSQRRGVYALGKCKRADTPIKMRGQFCAFIYYKSSA